MHQSTRFIRTSLAIFALLLTLSTLHAAESVSTDVSNSTDNIISQRVQAERQWRREGIVLIPHHFNYFLPYTYNTWPNTTPSDTDIPSIDHAEAKYQLSFKVLVAENSFFPQAHFYIAYTQLSMWQFYNNANSAPFRDTNYEPEAMLVWDMNRTLFGWNVNRIDYSLNHQSNGRSEPLSRSWNRAIATVYMKRGQFGLTVRPWFRFPEKANQDDNPDIEHYLGHGELTVAYSYRRQLVSMMLRNNFSLGDNKGAVELDYAFPLTRVLRGLVQYFYGYGECLLDYNHKNNRIGVGIALSEWR